jgi:hypothetical protein
VCVANAVCSMYHAHARMHIGDAEEHRVWLPGNSHLASSHTTSYCPIPVRRYNIRVVLLDMQVNTPREDLCLINQRSVLWSSSCLTSNSDPDQAMVI